MSQPPLIPDAFEEPPEIPREERYCRACGSLDVTIGPGKGPHRAKVNCRECHQVTWVPKRAGATGHA